MEQLQEICDRNGVALIEDACHAIGATIDGKAMGTFGRIGCFSFYSNKGMTTAEGGMLVTMDPKLSDQARKLRSHGQTKTAIDRTRGALSYDINEIGYNYRMDDLRASLGLAQLSKLDRYAASRKLLVHSYRCGLDGVEGVTFPAHGSRGRPADYLLPVLLDIRFDRDNIQRILRENGIQTSMHYPPVHFLSHYRDSNTVELPITECVARSCMTLPLYPNMSQDTVFRICDVLADVLD
jgi:dTDP-4-amino-4,6-dideoxygalactose transaminase